MFWECRGLKPCFHILVKDQTFLIAFPRLQIHISVPETLGPAQSDLGSKWIFEQSAQSIVGLVKLFFSNNENILKDISPWNLKPIKTPLWPNFKLRSDFVLNFQRSHVAWQFSTFQFFIRLDNFQRSHSLTKRQNASSPLTFDNREGVFDSRCASVL